MSAPDPSNLAMYADDLTAALPDLMVVYRWLYPSAYARGRRGEVVRVSGGGVSDSASLMVGNVAHVRDLLEESAKLVVKARGFILEAQAHLNDAAKVADRSVELGPSVDVRALPHPADQGDLDRAREAKKRRDDRVAAHALPWATDETIG